MSTTIPIVFYNSLEKQNYLDTLADSIRQSIGKDSDLLLDHPSLYLHVWRSQYDVYNGTYSVYIGETNNVVERTKEHWAAAKIPKSKRDKGNWQHHMVEDVDVDGHRVIPTVFFFGHKLLHKSLTLDIENRLIDYCYALPTAHVLNGRTNPQGSYAGDEYLDDIFSMIWKTLRNEIPELFLPETEIKKSAIYKASPNHKLTTEQKNAKSIIIDRAIDAVLTQKKRQLIFVEGEAGTGKTVLTSSTLYDFLDNELFNEMDAKRFLLVNHAEQKIVYENMARKMGYGDKMVLLPTEFLNQHSVLNKETNTMEPDLNNIADIVFVDEAHLLWNARNQAYTKKFKSPQLDEIIKRSRVTVIMFDENQVLHRGQVFYAEYMDRMRELAKSQGPDPKNDKCNYIILTNQLRMNCAVNTIDWIDSISKDLRVSELVVDNKFCDSKGYEIRVFDNPAAMHELIKTKAKKGEDKLSRVVATMDWEYKNTDYPRYKHYWDIEIGGWSIPWNEEVYWRDKYWELSEREKRRYKMMDWAEKDYSIGEAGSTFTVQGFDLSYVGVILGPSVKYDKEKNEIWFDEQYRSQDYMKGFRVMEDGKKINVTSLISKHEIRVLLTRGTKGLFIYACDSDLREALNAALKTQ